MIARYLAGLAFAFLTIGVSFVGSVIALLIVWFVTRESWETFGTLVRFWWRVPMEFIVGVLPFMAAGALFAALVVSGMRPTRRREPA